MSFSKNPKGKTSSFDQFQSSLAMRVFVFKEDNQNLKEKG